MSYTRQCRKCGDIKPLGQFPRTRSGRATLCRPCDRERARTRLRDADAERDRRLRRTYGITAEDYGRMAEDQGGRCAICDRPPRPRDGRLVVDHDHATGRVRALLCSPCNSALGLMGDKADRLVSAARYLTLHMTKSSDDLA